MDRVPNALHKANPLFADLLPGGNLPVVVAVVAIGRKVDIGVG